MGKVIVIGGTGNVGNHTVKSALDKGHHVTAFGRSIEKVEASSPNLSLAKGDVLSDEDLRSAIPGHDTVILTFGAPLNLDTVTSTPSLCEDGTRKVVAAMREANVDRLIAMTSLGAGDSDGHGRFVFRNLIAPAMLGRILEDRTAQENVVRGSGLANWAIVRPTELSDDEPGEIRVITDLDSEPEPETIARADVGRMLADMITNRTYDQSAIVITN